jgi:hypothetical protein
MATVGAVIAFPAVEAAVTWAPEAAAMLAVVAAMPAVVEDMPKVAVDVFKAEAVDMLKAEDMPKAAADMQAVGMAAADMAAADIGRLTRIVKIRR